MPPFQPACLRKFAVDASASGTLSIRSRRPSPSPSTASLRYVDGMNWVWPKAPAQEPRSFSGAMPSSWMILSVAKNSPENTPAGGHGRTGSTATPAGNARPGLSVVALHAPDCGDDRRIHAVAGRGALQIRPPALHARLAIGHALVIDQRRHVVPDGRAELGLEIQQIQHAHVGASVAVWVSKVAADTPVSAPAHAAGPGSRRSCRPPRRAWRAAKRPARQPAAARGIVRSATGWGDGMGGFHPVGSHDYRVGEAACKAASSVSSKPAARRASRLNGPRRRGAPCSASSA